MKTKSQINIFTYIGRRILMSIPVLFGIITIAFFISRAVPGDPAFNRLPVKALSRFYELEREKLGLDQPIILQYFIFIKLMFTGDWGYSIVIAQDTEIWFLIWERLPRTLELIFISIFIATYIGLKIGKKQL